MPLKERLYKYDQAILKKLTDDEYRLTVHKVLRTKGLEVDYKIKLKKGSVNDTKLDNNISRTKLKIYELGQCNSWDWFCTFTIDGKKYNRHDLKTYHKRFSQWLRDYSKKHGLNIKYLIIPETHKDGAWHEHGLISGLPKEHLVLFDAEKEKLPKYIREKLFKGEKVYNWVPYAQKFGWCDIEPIKSKECVSKYITKYITKDMSRCVTEINAKSYYCSQGLKRAEEIKRGTMSANIVPDWENEWVKLKTLNSVQALKILSKIV